MLVARRPTTAVPPHGGAPMVSHWMALKQCAAGALMSARHKESQAETPPMRLRIIDPSLKNDRY